MNGVDKMKQLNEAGFTQEEMGQYLVDTSVQLRDSGFRQDEIDAHWGNPHVNEAPLKQLVSESVKSSSTNADGTPQPSANMADAFLAGLQGAIGGMIATEGKPSIVVPEDAPRAQRIVSGAVSLLADSPVIAAGYLLGGGTPITGTAGAVAAHRGIRSVLMDKYEKGEVTTFGEFWDRLSTTVIETGKGLLIGGATGAVGKVFGMAPISSPTAKAAAQTSAEVVTMVSVGSAIEGHMPNANEFIDAALTLGVIKGSAKMAGKLRDIYKETGVRPADVVADAQKDPTILQDLVSGKPIPQVYEDAMARQRAATEPKKPVGTGKIVETPPPAPSIAELAGRAVQPEVGKTSETGAFYPPGQPPVARVTPPYEAKPAPMPSAMDLVTGKAALDAARESETKVLEKPRALRTAEEILQERNRLALRAAEEMIPQTPRSTLREAKYFPPKAKATPEETMTDAEGRQMSTGQWLAKELEKDGIVVGEDGVATWEKNAPVGDAQKAILSKIVQTDPVKEGLTWRGIYTSIVDNLDPILADLRKVGKDKLPVAENPYSLQRLTRGISAKAKHFMHNGAFDFSTLETTTKGYEAILEPVKKDLDGFRAYMVSKRVIEKEGQGIKTGFDITAARQVVRDGVSKYESVHQERLQYRGALLDYLEQSGILNRADRAKFEKANKDYVGFHRFFEEEGESRFAASSGVKSPFKKMEGGERPIHDPIVSDIKDTFLFIGLADKNAARQAYVKAMGPEHVQRIPEAKSAVKASDIKQLIDEYGVSEETAQAVAKLRPSAFTMTPGKMVVFENGERHVYKVDPKTAEAFEDLNRVSTSMVANVVLHAPAAMLRAGVVLRPEFQAMNLVRDAFSSFIYAGSSPIKTAKGLASFVTKDEAYQKWLKSGGGNATMVAIDRDYLSRELTKLNAETGLMERSWNVMKTPWHMLHAISEGAENATRIGAIRSDILQAKTKAQIQALGMMSREATVDFARHGRDTKEFAKMTAFFNPSVQGIDRFMREMRDNPMAMMAKATASITVPSLLLWWANRDDKEIQDLPAWEKAVFWHARVPLPDGGSFIARLPKPQELGLIFGTLPDRLAEEFFTENPESFKGFEQAMLNMFVPNLIPTAPAALVEQFSNRSLFTGGPLVPSHLEKLLPEYQYTNYTTETSKALGQLFGAFPGIRDSNVNPEESPFSPVSKALSSPLLIEHYVRAWTGGLGMYALQLADKGLREAGVVPDPVKPASALADIPVVKAFVSRYPSATAQSVQDFYNAFYAEKKYYDTATHLEKQAQTTADLEKVPEFEEKGTGATLSGLRDTLSGLNALIHRINKNPDYTPEEKRQLIDTQYYQMIQIAQYGNTLIREMRNARTPIQPVSNGVRDDN